MKLNLKENIAEPVLNVGVLVKPYRAFLGFSQRYTNAYGRQCSMHFGLFHKILISTLQSVIVFFLHKGDVLRTMSRKG